VSQPRPSARRAVRRLAVVGAALVALLLAGTGIASAHVTVSSPNAAAGGFGTVVLTVPNESDTANTVRLRVQMPPKTPFSQVLAQPVPGWTITTTSETLATPVKDDDGNEITTAISVVDFQAATGGGIPPGQFQQFSLSVGPFPDAKSVSFSAVQTYSDGSEVAWIDPTIEGQPEPEHPAPTLTLTAASNAASASASSDPAASSDGTSSSGGPGSDGLPLFLSIAALVLGLAGVVLGWRAQRRTVNS
jgi:periplasmic copper chaperone A